MKCSASSKRLVKTFTGAFSFNAPRSLTVVGNLLYFVADDGITGQELWKTDGTAAGTVIVKNIMPGALSSSPKNLTNINGTLYFSAIGLTTGRELYTSNGQSCSTNMVQDLYIEGDSDPSDFALWAGKVHFAAARNDVGRELFRTDFVSIVACKASDEEISIVEKPVHPSHPSQFNIYPNPANKWLNIEITVPAERLGAFKIFDISGRMLVERKVSLDAGVNAIDFDTGSLADGVYIIRYADAAEQKTMRLLVQH